LRRWSPMAEGEEADLFHVSVAYACCVRARYRVLATRARPSCVDAAGLWPRARNELLPKSDGSGAPGGAGQIPRHAVGVAAFCASGAASPLRISPAAEGDAEGGAPPGAPPRRLLFARRRPCCRCRDRLAKRPSPRKVFGMWFRRRPLSIGKGHRLKPPPGRGGL